MGDARPSSREDPALMSSRFTAIAVLPGIWKDAYFVEDSDETR